MPTNVRLQPLQPRRLYWIDESCDEAAGGNFEAYILEARHWARRAYERLRSPTDTDFARVFNLVIKTPKTDALGCSKPSFWQQVHGLQPSTEFKPSVQHVCEVLYDFAHGWARANNRADADVRIYSSARGLQRWRVLPTGTRYDPINHIHLTGSWDNLTAGQAFTSWVHGVLPVPGENPNRTTIDICPSAWQPSASSRGHLSLSNLDPTLLLPEKNEVKPVTIADLAPTLLPRLLFHEFMHSRHYLLDDHPRDGATSGWEYCMRRKKGEAAGCGESLAMLGLWAALADMRPSPGKGTGGNGQGRGGFTVDRAWDRIPGEWDDLEGFSDDEDGNGNGMGSKWEMGKGNTAVSGELKFYEDITN